MSSAYQRLRPLWWDDDAIVYLDTRAVPDVVHARVSRADEVIEAIDDERLVGAGTLDLFGAFGVAFARREGADGERFRAIVGRIRALCGFHALHPAIDRVADAQPAVALAEAQACLAERSRADDAIARNAFQLLNGASIILSDCASGALATGESGTALSCLIWAQHAGQRLKVYLSEGQASREVAELSAFELQYAGIPATRCSDSAAAWLLQTAGIDAVLVGAKAIGADAQAVCRIGTYGIALAAAHHGIPCYLAASRSIVDRALMEPQLQTMAAGDAHTGNAAISRNGASASRSNDASVMGLAYDVTPGRFFSAIVTEYGITRPPYAESLIDLFSRPHFKLLTG